MNYRIGEFKWKILVLVCVLGAVFLFLASLTAVGAEQPALENSTDTLYLPAIAKSRGPFLETFDGDPSAPTPWRGANWDVVVHSRDRDTWYQLESMAAAHGPDCSPPPATHTNTSYEGAVYQCKNHMMTAIQAGGYGVIYLTPNRMVDFTSGTATIRFDISTLRTSGRDWWDIWITPYQDNLIAPLSTIYPDLSGEPRRAIHIELEVANQGLGSGRFKANVINGHSASSLNPATWGLDYVDFLVPDARRRDTFEIQISRYGLKFGMPDYNQWWFDTTFDQPLDWSKGIVQLGHHSYNPSKACNHNGTCGANSWHWDNMFINPSLPFTITPAATRYTEPSTGSTLSFDAPAPPDAHLRFSGIGRNIQVSFDGGSSWQSAQMQSQERYDDGHFRTYWQPIPSGVQSVKFRADDWWGGAWHVRDATIWSPHTP